MTAAEALRLARESGVRIVVSGAGLILDAEREPAPAVLESVRRHKAGIVALLTSVRRAWAAEDWQEFFDERAAIAEFDGGQAREQAEARAYECCIVRWLDLHPVRSEPDRCAKCGRADQPGSIVLFGAEPAGHVWLHPGCWQQWFAARRAEAAMALAATGIRAPAELPDDFGKNGGA